MSNNVYNYTEDDKKKIKGAIQELSDSFTRVASERDWVKSILERLNDDIGIDKKLLRKMAKTYYNGSFNLDKSDFEDFETAYNQIVGILV